MRKRGTFSEEKYDSKGARIGCLTSTLIIAVFIVFAIMYRDSSVGGIFGGIAFATLFVSSCVIIPINGRAKERNYRDFIESLPEIKVSVRVISKTTEVKKEYGKNASVNTIYYISFQLSDGSRKNLTVDVSTYNTIMENEEGILTYKENNDKLHFVTFQNQQCL
jgi:hypothetical protein